MNENETVLLGGMTDKGPVREANEDAFALPNADDATQLGMLVVVADGVGGQEHGALASATAVNTLRPAFYDARLAGTSVPDALRAAVATANQAVYAAAQTQNAQRMGCTLVAAVQDQDQLYAAHIGDARLYRLRSAQLQQLTRDDTWVQRQVDAGLLTPEQAATHELRNVVTRVMGNEPEVEAHFMGPEPLLSGDHLLLCSDGLYDVLSSERMASLMERFTPQEAAEALVQAAVEAGASDNVTAVVLKVGELAEQTLSGMAPVSPPQSRSEPPTATPPPVKEQSRGSWLVILLAAIGLIAIVAVIGYALLNNGTPTAEATATPASSMEQPAVDTDAPAPTPLPTSTSAALSSITPLAEATQPSATDAPPPTPSAEAAPTASPAPQTCEARVSAVQLNVRDAPATGATILTDELFLGDLVTVRLDVDPVEEQNYTWWSVVTQDGTEGWITSREGETEYLDLSDCDVSGP